MFNYGIIIRNNRKPRLQGGRPAALDDLSFAIVREYFQNNNDLFNFQMESLIQAEHVATVNRASSTLVPAEGIRPLSYKTINNYMRLIRTECEAIQDEALPPVDVMDNALTLSVTVSDALAMDVSTVVDVLCL